MAKWPNVYPQGDGWIVDCGKVDGKRKRIYKPSKSAATKEANRLRENKKLSDAGLEKLTFAQMMDAAKALHLLAGSGQTLEGLARKYADCGDNQSKLLGDLYDEYYRQREKVALKDVSLTGIKTREGRFAARWSGIQLHAITPEMVEAWVDEYDIGPVSRRAYIKAARTLLNYAVKRRYIGHNVADQVETGKVVTKRPLVFDKNRVISVLLWCMDNRPEMVAYHAIGFFGGLRPDETRRLIGAEINMHDGLITVAEDAGKTNMRHVGIRSNLRAWLREYPPQSPVYWKRYWHDKMTKALRIEWPHDVCRKTFVSYHLAAFRNLNETVQEAGHRSSDMIHMYYRNVKTDTGQLITSATAAGYWSITPKTAREWQKNQ